ncbi:MAG: hypothetical protein JSS14_14970 [Proteobacteria bacterium]|nr:hypothetical protein [Pseudomonadota bacterium]
MPTMQLGERIIFAARQFTREWKMISQWNSKSRPGRSPMLSLAFGMSCLVAGSVLSAQPAHKYDGVYYGKRVLTKGTPSRICPAEDDVSVAIEGNLLTFTDSALKKFVEPFQPRPDGSFGEIYIQARGGGATVEYHGRVVGDIIEADVVNYLTYPPCEYRWRLKKGR